MKQFLILLLFLSRVLTPNAQVPEHARWDFTVEKIKDNKIQLVVTASLDSGWHIYSSTMEDGGPQKTIINVDADNKIKVAENIGEEGNIVEKFDSSFNITLRYYPQKAIFKKEIDIAEATPFTLKGNVSYMLCTDEVCLPPAEQEFSLNVPAVSELPAVSLAKNSVS